MDEIDYEELSKQIEEEMKWEFEQMMEERSWTKRYKLKNLTKIGKASNGC